MDGTRRTAAHAVTRSKPTSRERWPPTGRDRELLTFLDDIREANGRKSLRAIAEAMGLTSASRINDILRGVRPPTDAAQLMALTRALGGSVEDAERAAATFDAIEPVHPVRPELPRLPGHFVSRNAERALVLQRLAELAGAGRGALGLASTTALHGTGGYGKTTLALDVCRQPEVAQLFPGGVIWVELGQEPVVAAVLADVTARLSNKPPVRYETLESATAAFVAALGDQRVLLVLDNAWRAADIDPFLRGGPRCVRLVTSRRVDVLPAGTPVVPVDRMAPEQAVELLCRNLPGATREAVYALYERSHRWPVLLGVLNGVMQGRLARVSAQPLPEMVADLAARLDRLGITGVDDIAEPALRTAHDVLELGVDELAGGPGGARLRDRFLSLAAFPADHLVTFDLLQRLWRCDRIETRTVCDRLADRSLLGSVEREGVRLHDVIHAHLVTTHADDVLRWAGSLLDMLQSHCPDGAWYRVPDALAGELDMLAFLLVTTGRRDELRWLLLDLRYLAHRIDHGGLAGLTADIATCQSRWEPDPRLSRLNRVVALEGHLAARVSGSSAVAATLFARLIGDQETVHTLTAVEEALALAPTALHPMPDRPDPRLLRVLSGHADRVLCVGWRADGNRLASGSADGELRIWDGDGQLQRVIGLAAAVNALAWSPDQLHVAALVGESTVCRVDPVHGEIVAVLERSGEITCLAWSPDSTTIALGHGDGTVARWVGTAMPVITPPAPAAVRALDWSVDGLVAAHSDGVLTRWTGDDHVSGPTGLNVPRALHTRPGHAQVAVGGADRGIVLADLDPEPTLVAHSGATAGWVTSLRWSGEGSRLAAGMQDGTVEIWSADDDGVRDAMPDGVAQRRWAESLAAEPRLDFHGVRVATLDWHPTRTSRLAVGAASDVRLFDVAGMARRLGHDGINCLRWHPALPLLTAGTLDGELLVIDRPDLDPMHRRSRHAHPEQVRALAPSHDGRWIATVAEDGPLLLWRLATLDAEPVPCPVTRAGALAWSPDDRWLAVGGQGEVALLDRTMQVRHRIAVDALVNGIDIDPTGTRIAIATSGSTITVRGLTQPAEIRLDAHLSSVGAVRWAGLHRLVSAGYDGQALVWSVADRAVQATLDAAGGAVWDVAVRGEAAFTATAAGLLGWHDLAGGVTHGHIAFDSALSSCAVSADGTRLAAAGAAGIALFRLPVDHAVRPGD